MLTPSGPSDSHVLRSFLPELGILPADYTAPGSGGSGGLPSVTGFGSPLTMGAATPAAEGATQNGALPRPDASSPTLATAAHTPTKLDAPGQAQQHPHPQQPAVLTPDMLTTWLQQHPETPGSTRGAGYDRQLSLSSHSPRHTLYGKPPRSVTKAPSFYRRPTMVRAYLGTSSQSARVLLCQGACSLVMMDLPGWTGSICFYWL